MYNVIIGSNDTGNEIKGAGKAWRRHCDTLTTFKGGGSVAP